jgi:putative flippase GtrA
LAVPSSAKSGAPRTAIPLATGGKRPARPEHAGRRDRAHCQANGSFHPYFEATAIRSTLNNGLRWAYRYRAPFIAYFLVGGASALIEWSLFAVLHFGAGLDYPFAAVGAYFLATYANYLLSVRYAFDRRGRSRAAEIGLVYLASALAFAVNLGVMTALVVVLDIPTMPAKILGTGAAFLWNYLLRQFVVFHHVPPTWRQLLDRLPARRRAPTE